MLVIDIIAGISLHTARDEAAIDIAGDAIKEKVAAGGIRHEVDAAIAANAGDLEVKVAEGFLVGDDGVIILFVLAFVEVGGIERRGLAGEGHRRSARRTAGGLYAGERPEARHDAGRR